MPLVRRALFAFAPFLIAGIAGCVSADATKLAATAYEPIPPEQVTIYMDEADAPTTYEKVALINLRGETGWTNEKGMYSAARKKAAKLGANGLILGDIDEPTNTSKLAGAFLGVPVNRKSVAVAIRTSPHSVPRPARSAGPSTPATPATSASRTTSASGIRRPY